MRRRLTALTLVATWLVAAPVARAVVTQSLSTEFVEVLVEGVPLASRYVVEGKPVDISNKGDVSMKVRFDASTPAPSEMRAGYEPIPDPAWVGFEPRTVELGPGQTGQARIVFYMPDDASLVGKRYQAMLVLHSDAPTGSILGVALRPRLLFSVAPRGDAGKTAVVDRPQVLARLEPYQVSATQGWLSFDCGRFTAVNVWNEEMTFEVVRDSEAVKRIDVGNAETAIPDLSWIEVLPQAVVLPGHSKAELAVTARLPIAPEHFGRIYVAALRTVATRKGQKPVSLFNKVRIAVPKLAFAATGTGAATAK